MVIYLVLSKQLGMGQPLLLCPFSPEEEVKAQGDRLMDSSSHHRQVADLGSGVVSPLLCEDASSLLSLWGQRAGKELGRGESDLGLD